MEIGIGLGCNGIIDVLLRPLKPYSDILKVQKCTAQRRTHHRYHNVLKFEW